MIQLKYLIVNIYFIGNIFYFNIKIDLKLFFSGCINEWLRNHSNCPYCRTLIVIDNSRTTARRRRTRTRRNLTRSSTNNSLQQNSIESSTFEEQP